MINGCGLRTEGGGLISVTSVMRGQVTQRERYGEEGGSLWQQLGSADGGSLMFSNSTGLTPDGRDALP